MKYEEIEKVCSGLKGIDVKDKNYIQVNQRVIAFRKLFPEGSIETSIWMLDGGVCVFKASAYDGDRLLATGYAYEKEGSTFINKTSYIENAETSAVGRCLGFIGIGIDDSIASAEEVQNAILNQGTPVEESAALRKIILTLGTALGKDAEYTKTWCEKLFGNTTKWADMNEAQLTTAKLKLSEKVQSANKGK